MVMCIYFITTTTTKKTSNKLCMKCIVGVVNRKELQSFLPRHIILPGFWCSSTVYILRFTKIIMDVSKLQSLLPNFVEWFYDQHGFYE